MSDRYDAIVIGSGMGGLTCAVVLAKSGHERVLLLEKHHQLGGQTQSFSRPPGYHWDVGLHYIARGDEHTGPRNLFDYVTDGALAWHELPDPYDVFHYPELRFSMPVGEERLESAIVDRFPEERAGIERYFHDVHRASQWLGAQMMRRGMPRPLDLVVGAFLPSQEKLALRTTKSYLDEHLRSPALRALLASQWGDYGLPPGESAFGIHAMVSSAYYEGAAYPVGGGRRIARDALRVLDAHGGKCLASREVTRILMDRGRAVGVLVHHHKADGSIEREEYRADAIVSDVGAVPTYLALLPEDVPLAHRDEIRAFPHGASAVILYLGLDRSPAELGVRGENHWVYDTFDHDAIAARSADVLEGQPHGVFVSFGSLRDPEAKLHTAEVVAFADFEPFARWAGTEHGARPADYEALAERISDGLLRMAERAVPGLGALVRHRELSTPLTMRDFTGHPFGAFYGVPAVPERFRLKWTDVVTEVPGLYLTGEDVACLGVPGAAMGGAMTAAQLMGVLGFPKVMSAMAPR
jgi:phytoene dehydrogenase-like protein